MTSLILLAATNPAAEIGERFGFNGQIFSMHLVGFAVLAFLLQKYAYGPILKVLELRRQKIADGLANAEKIKVELASAQAKAQELLTQASVEANKHIEEARKAASRVLETETQKAVATANEIIAKARQASDAELARLKAELRREVGRLVVETTAKVAGKVLTSEDQQRLADEATRHLAA